MKKLVFIVAMVMISTTTFCQTVTKEIFGVDLDTKLIYELRQEDEVIGYSFSFVDLRYAAISRYEELTFFNYSSMKRFFFEADSVFNKYEPDKKESVSLKLRDLNVRVTWFAKLKTIYIHNEDGAYFALNKYNMEKVKKFLVEYDPKKN